MAPKRGSKRKTTPDAAGELEASEKKPRIGAELQVVADTIKSAEALPADVRSMLSAMLPFCLGMPADERDEHQAMAVTMIGETLYNMKAKLETTAEEESAKVEAAEASNSELAEKMVTCEADLTKRKETVADEKITVAAKDGEAKAAKTACADAQKAQKAGDGSLEQSKELKEQLEAVAAAQFKELQEGSFDTEKDAKKLLSAVLPLLKKVKLEESLQMAVPASCAKKPEVRSTFDKIVFEQLGQQLAAAAVELGAELEAAAPGKDARAAAVQTAQQALDAAQEAAKAAANTLKDAQDALKQAETALKEAKKAAAEAEPALSKATATRDKAAEALESFATGPVTYFETLRDKTAAKPCEEETAAAPLADEVPAPAE